MKINFMAGRDKKENVKPSYKDLPSRLILNSGVTFWTQIGRAGRITNVFSEPRLAGIAISPGRATR